MNKVYNQSKDKDIPEDAIYVGRPSKYGNPFSIGKDGNREEVIAKYEKYLLNHTRLLKDIKRDLRGKDLVCFCKPLACHADIIMKYANESGLNMNNIIEEEL
jgi:hypothetical protein